MLQQTRVEVVVPYYERFLARFPTVLALAQAPESEVLAFWSGLGYYSRGRRLHETARKIVDQHGGRFPSRPSDVRGLPGVGEYTAGAVLSIAFGQREPAVDGNVRRILSRLAALELDLARSEGQSAVRRLAEHLVPMRTPGDFNQALMELGAQVCKPRRPRCAECPLAGECRAFALDRQEDFPRETSRTRSEDWIHVAAFFRKPDGRFLLALRQDADDLLQGLWHLPGLFLPQSGAAGAVEALELELSGGFGGPFRLGAAVAEARHQITFRKIRAIVYEGDATLVRESIPHARWTADPSADRLPTSSLLRKLLQDLGRPRQLDLLPEPKGERRERPRAARTDSARKR
jgi:A/G-specific adenine glycosylase